MKRFFEEHTSVVIICIVVSLLLCIVGSIRGISSSETSVKGSGLLKIVGDNLTDTIDTYQKQLTPNENIIQKNAYGAHEGDDWIGGNYTLSNNNVTFNFSKSNKDAYIRFRLKKPLELNETYTFSCEVSGVKAGESINFGILNQYKNNFTTSKKCVVKKTFIVTERYQNLTYLLVDDASADISPKPTSDITFSNAKLEKGTKATPYIE